MASAWFFAVLMERDPAASALIATALAERDLSSSSLEVLRTHGARVGRHAEAAASLRALLQVLDERRDDPDFARLTGERASFVVELAALSLAMGDVAGARRELAAELAASDADPGIGDRVLAREELRALWDLFE